MESGSGKAAIVDATAVYQSATNGYLSVAVVKNGCRHRRAFSMDAQAVMPGATHAVFSMVDDNGFPITSEPMPTVTDAGIMCWIPPWWRMALPAGLTLMQLAEQALSAVGEAAAPVLGDALMRPSAYAADTPRTMPTAA